LPPNVIAEYLGEIPHESVPALFASHDLFLFPTHGENFGHVIIESLSNGCPVLISDQTPWRRLAEIGVGWDIPLRDTDGFRAILQECIDMGSEQFRTLSERAALFGLETCRDVKEIERNRQVFLGMGSGSKGR
jgi:glycosyltransferase involved in cell wall biosynthesis